jgi:hypothetical protein
MNIDDRIEALKQTVELMAQMHRDNEERAAANEVKWDANEAKWNERFGKMPDIVERLDKIIQIHEARHNGHDDRLDNLERR